MKWLGIKKALGGGKNQVNYPWMFKIWESPL